MACNFFRGTSTDQVKCGNAEQKLVKKLSKEGRFPAHFDEKVDMSKVSMDVLKPWIARRITELLGFEDDIVIDYCIAQLTDDHGEKGLDAKILQVNMTAFMERKAAQFCSELWKNLISANQSPVGVPQAFIDEKKDELKKKKEEADRIQEELQRRKKDLEEAQAAQRSDREKQPKKEKKASRSPSRGRDDVRDKVPGVLGSTSSGRSSGRRRSPSSEPRERKKRRFE
mmetsp:Transcript_37991/g.60180  ORF Transcript_37991/g.60180 Transcript_37991/m.60180 type:complete len:227 (+) Transcript_37991:39-719(+)